MHVGMGKAFAAFLHDQSGVTGVEYAVIAFGVAVTLISAIEALGRHLRVAFAIAGALVSHGPTFH